MKNKKLILIIAIVIVIAAALAATLMKKDAKEPIKEEKVTETATPKSEDGLVVPDSPEEKQEENTADKKEVKASEKKEEKKAEEKKEEKEEQKTFTPTFMYFVSGADEGFDATNAIIDELKKEYKDKVNFDIRNIDDDPKLVENFPVGDGNTPTLIMLNTKNEISNILFKTADKAKLKQAIEAAMK